MNYLKERVAYLKGLAEGMQINDSTNEGKLLKAIIDVLDDFALSVSDIEEVQEQLSEQVDDIDEDLSEIEKILFDEDDNNDDDSCYGELECPFCNEKIEICEDLLDEEGKTIECPNCHKKIDVEWDCDCDECDDKSH
jgi:hypothetical protein